MNEKFTWTGANEARPILLKDLVCRDCLHRSGRTDICAPYPDIKPTEIFDGADCDYYKKES